MVNQIDSHIDAVVNSIRHDKIPKRINRYNLVLYCRHSDRDIRLCTARAIVYRITTEKVVNMLTMFDPPYGRLHTNVKDYRKGLKNIIFD